MLPENEWMVRPLTSIKNPDQVRLAWEIAVQNANGKPTAKHVTQAVQEVVGPKPGKTRKQNQPPQPAQAPVPLDTGDFYNGGDRTTVPAERTQTQNMERSLDEALGVVDETEGYSDTSKVDLVFTCGWHRDKYGILTYRTEINDSNIGRKIESIAKVRGVLPRMVIPLAIEALEEMPEKEQRINELIRQVRTLVESAYGTTSKLENQVQADAQKDTRISELVQANTEKDYRIQELGETNAQKDARIAELEQAQEAVLLQNEANVAELEQVNTQKNAQIEKLEQVVDIAEKSVFSLEEEKAALEEKLSIEEAESGEVVYKLEQVIVDQYNRISELEGKVTPSQSPGELGDGQVENPTVGDDLNKKVSIQSPVAVRSTAALTATTQTKSPNLSEIIDFFDKAAEKVETPSVSISLDGKSIIIMRNSNKYPGALNIKAAGIWFGRINRDGSLSKSREFENWAMSILVQFAANPEAMAQQHGKITGSCCFCARTLKDAKSIATGYGEICARHYGLPWPVLQANLVEPVPTAI